MDKFSYLSALQSYLLDLPESEIRAVLDAYIEQIDAWMQQGLSEAEAIERLPDPQTAAERILRGAAPVPSAPSASTGKRGRGLLILGLCLLLAAAALAVGSLRRAAPYEQRTRAINEPFSAVSVQLSDAELTVRPAEGGRCELRYEERSDASLFLIRVEDGELTVTQRDKDLSLVQRAPRVELLLPQGYYEQMELRSGSGSIVLSGPLQMETLRLKTGSGSVRAAELEAETLESVSASGSQMLMNVRAASLSAETSSGSVRLDDVLAESLRVKCTSGSQHLTDCVASQKAVLRATSGSIRFDELDAAQADLETSSGSIKGSVSRPMRFEGSVSSGTLKLPESDPGGGLFRVKATSGSVDIRVA